MNDHDAVQAARENLEEQTLKILARALRDVWRAYDEAEKVQSGGHTGAQDVFVNTLADAAKRLTRELVGPHDVRTMMPRVAAVLRPDPDSGLWVAVGSLCSTIRSHALHIADSAGQ